jgi:hypothetical protein
MHTDNSFTVSDRVVAYLVSDDAPAVDWLENMGVVAVDEDGAWKLTALGEAAMARFNGRYQSSEPVLHLQSGNLT